MTVYHTATQEDYDALMVELEVKGYRWIGTYQFPTKSKNVWDVYEEETMVYLKYNKLIQVGDLTGCLKYHKHEEIVEYKAKDKAVVLWVKEKKDSAVDNINKPTHYHSGNIDVIKFSEENFSKEEQKGFHRINAIKYITRYDKKGSALSDLNKAKFYIDKLIEMEESE